MKCDYCSCVTERPEFCEQCRELEPIKPINWYLVLILLLSAMFPILGVWKLAELIYSLV